jgi:hypothetical protein
MLSRSIAWHSRNNQTIKSLRSPGVGLIAGALSQRLARTEARSVSIIESIVESIIVAVGVIGVIIDAFFILRILKCGDKVIGKLVAVSVGHSLIRRRNVTQVIA